MTPDRTPWIVVRTDGPPGVMRLQCLRCGDTNDIPLPLAVRELTAKMDPFRVRHKDCKEPARD